MEKIYQSGTQFLEKLIMMFNDHFAWHKMIKRRLFRIQSRAGLYRDLNDVIKLWPHHWASWGGWASAGLFWWWWGGSPRWEPHPDCRLSELCSPHSPCPVNTMSSKHATEYFYFPQKKVIHTSLGRAGRYIDKDDWPIAKPLPSKRRLANGSRVSVARGAELGCL